MMSDYILQKATYYYFEMLTASEKEMYKKFLYALLNMVDIVEMTESFSSEQLKKISRYVINDRPDIFWYRGEHTITTRNGVIIKITFHYIYTKQQVDRIIKDIENSRFYLQLNSITKGQNSDFDKALKIYEFIIQNTEYEKNAVSVGGSSYEYAYGIEGVVLNHRAVCAGYAKTFQYFASKCNILCTLVTGQTKRSRHAWNLICLYGNYYYIDATWGDPTFYNETNKDPNYISYEYFCITTDELRKSHQPIFDDKMPICTSTKYNYYEYHGMVEPHYSVEGVAKQIVKAIKQSRKEVVIKYSTQIAYQNAMLKLFQQSEIFDALKMASRYVPNVKTSEIKYSVNDASRIITIKV